MQIKASTVKEYLESVPEDRKLHFLELRKCILGNLPKGFKEELNYGMIGYVVPHELYPSGYQCDPSKPLPFLNIASQKHFIGFYHMGIYSDPELLEWFKKEYAKFSKRKLDMGKSCIRFKKTSEIPLELIAKLVAKTSPQEWIAAYEKQLKLRK